MSPLERKRFRDFLDESIRHSTSAQSRAAYERVKILVELHITLGEKTITEINRQLELGLKLGPDDTRN